MGRLSGQVAVITGATRGIGRATAELFAAEGCSLALCARSQDALTSTSRELQERHGVPTFAKTADILSRSAIEGFIAEAGAAFGRIDTLVNNAGGSEQRAAAGSMQQVYAVDPIGGALPSGRFESMADEEFVNAFNQKVLALIHATRAVLPWMRKAGGGSIVNVVSMKGKQPPPRVVSSSIAAAAAMNLSKSLSRRATRTSPCTGSADPRKWRTPSTVCARRKAPTSRARSSRSTAAV
jgi:NAD(P)-dependent dehydrogenase (short-subunit alcohol dehydrogenase family)